MKEWGVFSVFIYCQNTKFSNYKVSENKETLRLILKSDNTDEK